MKYITRPFASFLLLLCETFNNYGWAILTFGLVVKLIMLPFQMKSKHSLMRTTMLAPRVKELEKKYGANKQKYQEEVANLYKEAKANPMSGCLWTLIPFPILIALYSVVRQPLTKLMTLAAEEVTALSDLLTKMNLYVAPARADAYSEMTVANILHENFAAVLARPEVAAFADKLKNLNFSFLGLNLTQKPRLFFWNYMDELGAVAAIVLFLLPFASAGLTMLQSKLTQKMQPAQDPQTAQSTKSMMLMMPLMSVYICFIMPAAMGIYWIEQSVLGIIQEAILNSYYKKKLDVEMAEFNEVQRRKDEELERKRAETERLKAEGRTQLNENTSKKRIAAAEKNAAEQRQAAQRAAERAAKGLEKELPESQVGNRRYARGRAYVADRYKDETAGAAETAGTEESVEAVETAEAVETVEAVETAEAVETVKTETPAEAAETPAAPAGQTEE